MGGYRPVLGVLKQERVLLTQKKSFTPQDIPSRINMSHISEKLKTLQNFQSSYKSIKYCTNSTFPRGDG
jgi:hypothetical protein